MARPGKAMFLAAFPNATIERQKPHFRAAYYLVRHEYGAHMWTGSGATPGEAWREACYAKGLAERPVKP